MGFIGPFLPELTRRKDGHAGARHGPARRAATFNLFYSFAAGLLDIGFREF